MRQFLLSSAIAALLTACGSFPVTERFLPTPTEVAPNIPVTNSADWIGAAGDALPQTDWTEGFGDSTLTALIDEALEKNTDIRIASARYDRALAQFKRARSDRFPSISANSRSARSEPFGGGGSINIPGGGVIPVGGGTTNLNAGVDLTWEADVWGRVRDASKSSEYNASAVAADYAAMRLLIASRVTQAWFDIVEAGLLVELSARDVQTLDRALRLTERRFDGGVASASDVRLARSAVSNAQALEASRKQNQASLIRGLEILLRRYPEGALALTQDLPALPPLAGAASPGYILTRRPDVLAAERRMHAAGLDVDVARKNLLPRITITSGLDSSGTQISEILDIQNIISNFAGGLTYPIFQKGALRADVAAQKALLVEQMENYTDTLLDAYLEVENALSAEQHLEQREAALRDALTESSFAEERLEARYIEGLATILELLDAQSRRISAEAMLISARKDRLTNRVALHVALGGGRFGEEMIRDVDDVVPRWKLNILSRNE